MVNDLNNKWLVRTVAACALAVMVVLAVLNLFLGDLNQDEGWYLYAARQVAQGESLYKDFAFTQGPMMPAVYAAAHSLWGGRGVAGGRAFTALLGMLSVLCAGWLAGRCVPQRYRLYAWSAAVVLAGVNVYQSYFTTIVKTYALCAVAVTAGLAVVTYSDRRRGWLFCFFSGALLACAAWTRLSSGIVLPVVFLILVCRYKIKEWQNWFAFGAGGGLLLFGIFLYNYVAAGEGFLFGVFEYHTLRSPGSTAYLAVLKAGFVSRLVQDYFVFFVLLGGLVLLAVFKRASWKDVFAGSPWLVGAWLSAAAVSLVHFAAPFPYDDYQVLIYPVAAAALAAGLVRVLVAGMNGSERFSGLVICILFAGCALAAFSSPVNQSWMIRGRDRIWWLTKDQPDLLKLQEAGKWLREHMNPGDLLFTQDAYLALEAGMTIPDGLELGPFSYYPDWTTEEAARRKVVNRERLLDLIRSAEAPYAAISGYGLSIESPDIVELPEDEQELLWDTLLNYYEPVHEVPTFGQAHTTLHILKRRPERSSQ